MAKQSQQDLEVRNVFSSGVESSPGPKKKLVKKRVVDLAHQKHQTEKDHGKRMSSRIGWASYYYRASREGFKRAFDRSGKTSKTSISKLTFRGAD